MQVAKLSYSLVGSRQFNTQHENSDWDYRGFYLKPPSPRLSYEWFYQEGKNEYSLYEINEFLLKGWRSPSKNLALIVSSMFAPKVFVEFEPIMSLYSQRGRFVNEYYLRSVLSLADIKIKMHQMSGSIKYLQHANQHMWEATYLLNDEVPPYERYVRDHTLTTFQNLYKILEKNKARPANVRVIGQIREKLQSELKDFKSSHIQQESL